MRTPIVLQSPLAMPAAPALLCEILVRRSSQTAVLSNIAAVCACLATFIARQLHIPRRLCYTVAFNTMISAAHITRPPRPSTAARGLVWLFITGIVLAGLMSVSPAIHAAFCPYESARQHPCPATADGICAGTHSHAPGDLDPADDDCIATLFQTGFLPALLVGIVPVAPSLNAVYLSEFFIVRDTADPVGLFPPTCGPPLGAG